MITWLITGCSSGLGRALACAVLARGQNVVLTAREPARVQSLVDEYPGSALALPLDITNTDQVNYAVQMAQNRFRVIDVLVNNAGYGYRAAVEEGDDSDVRKLFDTNFFGAVSMIKAVLPGMRDRRSGAIVNISSVGARICPPGSGYYSASKAALEGLSGSLRKELQPLGISVTVVEPGAFRTDFSGRSLTQSAQTIADYASTSGIRRKERDTVNGGQPGDPAKAAQAIIAVVESRDPPAILLLGKDALDLVGALTEQRENELKKWEELTSGTGFSGTPWSI